MVRMQMEYGIGESSYESACDITLNELVTYFTGDRYQPRREEVHRHLQEGCVVCLERVLQTTIILKELMVKDGRPF